MFSLCFEGILGQQNMIILFFPQKVHSMFLQIVFDWVQHCHELTVQISGLVPFNAHCRSVSGLLQAMELLPYQAMYLCSWGKEKAAGLLVLDYLTWFKGQFMGKHQ